MANIELPSIAGLRGNTRRNYIGASYDQPRDGLVNMLEPDRLMVLKAIRDDGKTPIERNFLLRQGPDQAPIPFAYIPETDADRLERKGTTPSSSQYVVHNGIYVETGRRTDQGTLSARYNKSDGMLIEPPDIDPIAFPYAQVSLHIPLELIERMTSFFKSLRELGSPRANDFTKIISVVDEAIPTSPAYQPQML